MSVRMRWTQTSGLSMIGGQCRNRDRLDVLRNHEVASAIVARIVSFISASEPRGLAPTSPAARSSGTDEVHDVGRMLGETKTASVTPCIQRNVAGSALLQFDIVRPARCPALQYLDLIVALGWPTEMRTRNRSSWASGSGYVPRPRWVLRGDHQEGRSSCRVVPSTVTWCSCMASSNAAWSCRSPIDLVSQKRFAKTGPAGR